MVPVVNGVPESDDEPCGTELYSVCDYDYNNLDNSDYYTLFSGQQTKAQSLATTIAVRIHRIWTEHPKIQIYGQRADP